MFLLAYGIHKGKDMMIYYTWKGQIIKLTFISCFLLPSFLVYEQPTNLQVSGKPIKFVGQGERIEDLEPALKILSLSIQIVWHSVSWNGRCTLICRKSTRSGECPLWNDPFLLSSLDYVFDIIWCNLFVQIDAPRRCRGITEEDFECKI